MVFIIEYTILFSIFIFLNSPILHVFKFFNILQGSTFHFFKFFLTTKLEFFVYQPISSKSKNMKYCQYLKFEELKN